jgi:hypothetical protein
VARPSGLDDLGKGEYAIKAGGALPVELLMGAIRPRPTEMDQVGAARPVLEADEDAVFSCGASAFQPPELSSPTEKIGAWSGKSPTLPLVAFWRSEF